MRVLVIGFLIFAAWAIFCTWFYVNKIKDFSPEPATVVTDTIAPVPEPLKAVMPEKMFIYFGSDVSTFTPDGQTQISIDGMKTWTDQNPGSVIRITGHTDASGSDKYNLELGNKRAVSVKDYLIIKGVAPERIITGSKGKEEPVADNNTPEGKAKNRRSEITIK